MDVTGWRRGEAGGGENMRLSLQQFIYDDAGFIACRANDKLVLGVHEQDGGHAVTVSLMNRRDEDVYQRWIVHDNGYQLCFFGNFSWKLFLLISAAVCIVVLSITCYTK